MARKRTTKRKTRTVNLGRKGSFKIKKPGVFKAKAKRAGMSTRAFASRVLANKGRYPKATVRQAASAKGLMAMKKRK